ncbi:MAG TPA: HipA domain-containing protein, partial [Xanthobacteraceae bacterium]|nr:HipA domain-containing protein [Xanthobacteraceae bacterium]
MTVRLTLDVWLDGVDRPAGTLDAMDDASLRFRYDPVWLDRTPRALSLSLPLGAAPIGDAVARAFFGNLLPENDQMRRVVEREGLDRDDIVGILAHVGADCPGAISCLPAGSPPAKVPGVLASDYRPLDEGEFAAIAEGLADRGTLPAAMRDPSPVAGVQRKIALVRLPDGRFALPRDGVRAPTTHILKVPRRADANDALLEDAACRMASAVGLQASRSTHVPIEGVDALLIERFDRIVADGTVYRVHQEDFAQALGLPAGLKYERSGGQGGRFDAAAIRALLRRVAHPAQAVEAFLLVTIFNLAIGNNDNHAKNHALLYDAAGTPTLAPFYDLLPVRLQDRFTADLAFRIGDATHFDDMERDDLAGFFATF